MTHTPEPWHVYNTCGAYLILADTGECSDAVIAEIGFDCQQEIIPANAHLMAAAPELLAELIAYHDREWLRVGHEGVPCHEAGEYPDDCAACRVIKKAKGE